VSPFVEGQDRDGLGLLDTSLSPAVTRMVGLAAALVSFAESSELLRDLAGVPVHPKQIERAVVEPARPAAPTLYLGLDGTGVPMRAAELVGRSGKQPDGSAKTREGKLVTVWTAAGRDQDGTPVRDAGSVTDSAALESAATRDTAEAASEFAQPVDREARRRGLIRPPPGRPGRRAPLDLEPGRRAVPRGRSRPSSPATRSAMAPAVDRSEVDLDAEAPLGAHQLRERQAPCHFGNHAGSLPALLNSIEMFLPSV
jgi:hypothetical protein